MLSAGRIRHTVSFTLAHHAGSVEERDFLAAARALAGIPAARLVVGGGEIEAALRRNRADGACGFRRSPAQGVDYSPPTAGRRMLALQVERRREAFTGGCCRR